MTKKIFVASANPVKINTCREAFKLVFPKGEFIIESGSVESEVPDQPIGVSETLAGAMNRVKNLRKLDTGYDFYVGIEGGIVEFDDDCYAFAWMYISSKSGKIGKGMTGFFELPPEIVTHLDKGYELGHAMDNVFSRENSKQKGGAVGLLTDGIIDRTNYYVHAMVLALIPFIKPSYFNKKQ